MNKHINSVIRISLRIIDINQTGDPQTYISDVWVSTLLKRDVRVICRPSFNYGNQT